MTKEITKANILQEIQDKFKLRELMPEKFSFSEMVIPVYDIESHLGKWDTETKTVSITSIAGFTFFTVPANERWFLRAYQLVFGATGAIKATGVLIINRAGAGDYIYLDMVKGQEVSYVINLPNPVLLNPGNRLQIYIDTYVSTQNLSLIIDVLKEEIR